LNRAARPAMRSASWIWATEMLRFQ